MSNNSFACLSLLSAGSMRFRWNEVNEKRNTYFENLFKSEKIIVPLELIHSKTVIAVNSGNETLGLQADGIITCNKNIVPVVTVADCMPIYLYDSVSGCFGVLHSGWKGTGIVLEALCLAEKMYGAKAENFHVVIGPHIKRCCYSIDENRAQYFIDNFSADCVETLSNSEIRLSLEKANRYILSNAGVKPENISIIGSCTSCSVDNNNDHQFGSFRRETSHLPNGSPIQEMQKHFTPMAAFMYVGDGMFENTEELLAYKIPDHRL